MSVSLEVDVTVTRGDGVTATTKPQHTGQNGRASAPIGVPVRVLSLKLLDGTGNLRAFCDLQLGNLKINGCRVVQQPGQRPWVAPPQREYLDGTGQKRWAAVVEWPRDIGALITDTVVAAFEAERDAEVPF